MQINPDWFSAGIQILVTLTSIAAGYTALIVRLVKIETSLVNILDSLISQGSEVRRIEERLGKLESRVAKIEGTLER
jgi:hypothetical protein